MKRLFKGTLTALILGCLCLLSPSIAAPAKADSRTPIKLDYGTTDIKLDTMSLRVVRAMVGTGSASDFDTFTIYVLAAREEDPWLHVTTPTGRGIGYNFRSYESGDANTQAVALYKQGGQLRAVLATKIGPSADRAGPRKSAFDLEVFSFNDSDDIPMFNSEGKQRTTGTYVDASAALRREFFGR